MDAKINILSQLAPLAATPTDLFTVARDGHALIQELIVCNRDVAAATFRVSISIRGAATAAADYLYYDAALAANTTFTKKLELTLSSFDVIRVYASNANFSFTVLGART